MLNSANNSANNLDSSGSIQVIARPKRKRNLLIGGGFAAAVIAAGSLFAAYKLGAFKKLKGLVAKKPDGSLSDLETALVDLVKPKRRRRRG